MSNSFLKPEVIANASVGVLDRELVLGRVVWSGSGIDFTGARGDTVSLRVPGRLPARELDWRGDPRGQVQMDSLAEQAVPVALNHHLYSAVPISDEELTLDIDNFGQRVLDPQVRAIATAIDSRIAAMIEDAPYETAIGDVSADDPYGSVIDARQALNQNNVPQSGRVLLVGAAFESALLKSDRLSRFDQSGSDTALRDATIGRMGGFTVVSSAAIDPNAAYAFVPSAFVVVTRAPVVPAGATFGASASFGGYSMRWIRDYDASYAQDRSMVSTFAGFNYVLDAEDENGDGVMRRAVKLTLAESGGGEDPS